MNTHRLALFACLQRWSTRAMAFMNEKAKAAMDQVGGQTYGEPELALDEAGKTAELRIYADIMPQMWCEFLGMGVSDTGFVRAMERIPRGYAAVCRINSNGGDVTVGIAIANRLGEAKVPVVIDGIAASIASIIAAASPHVTMKSGATVMLHNPWSALAGNARALRAEAAVLDTLRDAMLDIYHGKSGDKFSRDAWSAALDGKDGADGTWWTGDQAVETGFADTYERATQRTKEAALAIIEQRKTAAALNGVPLPKTLEELVEEATAPSTIPPNPDPAKSGAAPGAVSIKPSQRVSNRPGAYRIPR